MPQRRNRPELRGVASVRGRQVGAALRPAGDESAAVVDAVMGEGFAAALRGEGALGRPLANRLAEVWGKVVQVPFRRAAFLREARRAGYRTTRQVRQLHEDPVKPAGASARRAGQRRMDSDACPDRRGCGRGAEAFPRCPPADQVNEMTHGGYPDYTRPRPERFRQCLNLREPPQQTLASGDELLYEHLSTTSPFAFLRTALSESLFQT
jgi:hypothetical protein